MMPNSHPLDGTWELLKAEMAGEAAPEELSTRTRLRLADGLYWVFFDGLLTDRGRFETSEGTNAKALQLRGLEGPNEGRTLPCIYRHNGERLRVCYGLDGVAPIRFATAAGEARYLATYRRIER